MEKKKTIRANLENKKGIFLQIGFILALSAALLAFEWRTADVDINLPSHRETYFPDDPLPPTTVQPKPLPPPPKTNIIINIIDDNDPDPPDDYIIDQTIDINDPVEYTFQLSEEPDAPEVETPFLIVEEMPEFPGGEKAMYRYLSTHTDYPDKAKEVGIDGIVYVSFIVEKDGSLTDIKVLRSPNQLLSDEAVRVISEMPRWKPGKQRTKPVRVSYNIPIKFSLQ